MAAAEANPDTLAESLDSGAAVPLLTPSAAMVQVEEPESDSGVPAAATAGDEVSPWLYLGLPLAGVMLLALVGIPAGLLIRKRKRLAGEGALPLSE